MKFRGRLAIAAFLFSMLPAAAEACSACILADPKTSATYLKMTLVMSALPLSLLGGVTYWLWRRYSPRRSTESGRRFERLRNLRKAIN
jgi:membrane protein implicated in regulation of membrane protease activity